MSMRGGSAISLPGDDLDSMETGTVLRAGVRVMAKGSLGYRIATPLSIIAGLINGSTMVFSAVAIGWATDHLIIPAFTDAEVSARSWWIALGAIAGVSLLRVITIVTRAVAAAYVQYGNQASTRRALIRQYAKLGVPWHRRHSTGQLLSNVVSDVEVQWAPMQFFAFAMGSVFMLLVALANIARSDRYLAVVALMLVFVVLLANFVYQRVMSPRARDAQRARAAVSSVAHEAIEGEQVIRTLGIVDSESARFVRAAENTRVANTRMSFVSAAFDPFVELAPTATVLVVLLIGSGRVSAGELTVGTLVETIYLFLTMALPLGMIGRFLSILPLAVVGNKRTASVLDSVDYTQFGTETLAGEKALGVHVEAVRFTYDGALGEAIGPVELRFDAGDVVAVVGATGSGKTTLVRILARLADPDTGIVRYDGIDVRSLADGEIETRVAVVSQTSFLFDDTIRGNVTLGRDIDDLQVWRALDVAEAAEFVRGIPGGLDAAVGKRGASLSGGQRQRIALARGLAGSPSLLILDDATSALDPTVERDVLDNIRREFVSERGGDRRCTVVMTAARKSTVTLADRVLWMNGGVITASGTHTDLLAQYDGYRQIVDAYADGMDIDELDAAGGRS
ncbi:ABC transporter ATP-binding protein [Rhodococcus sp. WS3]|uniref:ABC-type multidrug transport system fused ATPase/permease subunit n=1 Tax=Nocardia globerula TaxID=1818 RepID=A0A652YJV7_NOCGL|nr:MULTISPECIES: ABC transporter ATP-binding protein [Rhodococcus]NMD61960.1 ABC transporter ATP-binding protein [Nocardia globerula]PVX65955.1 ABC-type multidrug transport system fused ATPase/permease subunit [Rhodococcus globerulus]ROZ46067.1 ABC transporter ATP-binding protein [Rhodococcus sp. WS3]RZL25162.1 MAG: ABC transporter ATP-binding protein [Rhodococcus sp. (in: high G+C Gram-positive bacteria)]